MCSACEGKPIEPHARVDIDLVRRARELEAKVPGERVPDSAWEIYFGSAGGSVEWRHFQRMHQALEEAERTQIRLRRGLRRVAAPPTHPASFEGSTASRYPQL
jgi:hypothetical protein